MCRPGGCSIMKFRKWGRNFLLLPGRIWHPNHKPAIGFSALQTDAKPKSSTALKHGLYIYLEQVKMIMAIHQVRCLIISEIASMCLGLKASYHKAIIIKTNCTRQYSSFRFMAFQDCRRMVHRCQEINIFFLGYLDFNKLK